MIGYDYELASINDLEKGFDWGELVILSEGVFFFDTTSRTYKKLEEGGLLQMGRSHELREEQNLDSCPFCFSSELQESNEGITICLHCGEVASLKNVDLK